MISNEDYYQNIQNNRLPIIVKNNIFPDELICQAKYALAQRYNSAGKAHSDSICFTPGQNNVFKCRLTYCKSGMKEGEMGIRKDGVHLLSYS
jgi:hypothetical protein